MKFLGLVWVFRTKMSHSCYSIQAFQGAGSRCSLVVNALRNLTSTFVGYHLQKFQLFRVSNFLRVFKHKQIQRDYLPQMKLREFRLSTSNLLYVLRQTSGILFFSWGGGGGSKSRKRPPPIFHGCGGPTRKVFLWIHGTYPSFRRIFFISIWGPHRKFRKCLKC